MLRLYCWTLSRLYGLRDQKGATAVEYGIMVALIAVVIIATVYALGQSLRGMFSTVAGYIAAPATAP